MEITNKKHLAFAQEYLLTKNATRSYMKVYGVEYSSAEVLGPKLLGNVRIQQYLAEEDNKIATKFEITREFIAQKLIEVVNDSDAAGDRKNKISALNSLTKMFGLDAPIKQEVEHRGIIINITKPE